MFGGLSVPFGDSFLAMGGLLGDLSGGVEGIYTFDSNTEGFENQSQTMKKSYQFGGCLIPDDFIKC